VTEFPKISTGTLMSGNAFNFLGVAPMLGRTIEPTDIAANGQAQNVTVLSYVLWHPLFQGNPAAIGKTISVNGQAHTIIGVMPPRFGWYGNDGLWLPVWNGCRG
jgi:putative ABC transport system permease protein